MKLSQNERATWKRFGALVNRLRKVTGLGLRELSKRATKATGGRGLSAPYLSEIERGRTAPPRQRVLRVLADILQVPLEKLELTARGWVVLDPVEVLEPYREYATLLEDMKVGKFDPPDILEAMLKVAARRKATD